MPAAATSACPSLRSMSVMDVPAPPRPLRVHPRRLLVAIACIIIAADQVTKALAVHFLAGRGIVDVDGGAFHLELYRNFAGSGNRLTGHPVAVSLLAVVAVAVIATVATRVRTRTTGVAVGLLLGGGSSNLLDRLLRAPGPLRGGVVDWLKPTLSSGSMNLADLTIGAGVAVFVITSLIGAVRHRTEDPLPGPA
jgi:signal peptidase II